MALGISFGKNKTKTDQTTDVNKTENTSQTGKSTTATSGTTTNVGSTSQSGATTGTTSTSQAGTSSQVGSQVGQTSQRSSLFSENVQGGLEGAVGTLLGSTVGAPHTTVGNFDPTAFIEGGLRQAKATQGMQLEDSINQLISGIGGTPGSNSATALLANRMRGDAAANFAGIEGNLNAQANDIVRNNALAGNTIDATQEQFLSQLLGALKGGEATTVGSEAQQTNQSGTTSQTGSSSAAETNDATQNTQSTQTQDLLQILDQLLNGVTTTVGTEHTKGTQSKVGGGISLSM